MNNEIAKESWFSKNKFWALPTGGCLLVVLVVGCIILMFFVGLKETVFESGPYKYAVEEASNNLKVKEVLGDDIITESIFSGRITIDNDQHADFKIPLKGNKNKGFVFVIAERENKAQEWQYKKLYVIAKNSADTIYLLNSRNKE